MTIKILRRGARIFCVFALNVTTVALIGEALCRYFFHQSMNFDMEMWRYANTLKQKSSNPDLGHEHRPSKTAFLMGVQVDTNSHGMRDNEASFKKGENVFRIVLLGDSLTMGWGVPQNQLYAHLLEVELNQIPPDGFRKGTRFEVLNFGVGNYNTVQEVALLRHKAISFDPDLILLGYFVNDAEKLKNHEDNFFITHSFLYAFSKSVSNRFAAAENENYRDYYSNLYRDDQFGWQQCQQGLEDLVVISKQNKVPILMFILPELHDLTQRYPFADIHQKLTNVARNLGLPVVDLLRDFTNYAGREEEIWVSPTDAHPNARVQPLIAEALYKKIPWVDLAKKETVPCEASNLKKGVNKRSQSRTAAK
jgi:lysophospholipase L1-like esterase